MSGDNLKSCTGDCGAEDCDRCGSEPSTFTELAARVFNEPPPSTAEVARRMRNGQRVNIPEGCIGYAPLQADDDMHAPRSFPPPCPDERYRPLWDKLMRAWSQAVSEKGAERHGTPEPYESQPTFLIGKMFGAGFHYGQAMKKLIEAQRLEANGDVAAANRERLGVIVYTSFGITESERVK